MQVQTVLIHSCVTPQKLRHWLAFWLCFPVETVQGVEVTVHTLHATVTAAVYLRGSVTATGFHLAMVLMSEHHWSSAWRVVSADPFPDS